MAFLNSIFRQFCFLELFELYIHGGNRALFSITFHYQHLHSTQFKIDSVVVMSDLEFSIRFDG